MQEAYSWPDISRVSPTLTTSGPALYKVTGGLGDGCIKICKQQSNTNTHQVMMPSQKTRIYTARTVKWHQNNHKDNANPVSTFGRIGDLFRAWTRIHRTPFGMAMAVIWAPATTRTRHPRMLRGTSHAVRHFVTGSSYNFDLQHCLGSGGDGDNGVEWICLDEIWWQKNIWYSETDFFTSTITKTKNDHWVNKD